MEDFYLVEDDADREHYRFGAYILRGGELVQEAATPRLEGVGLMLATLAQDRRDYANLTGKPNVVPVIGLLDRVERHWLTSLWHPATRVRDADD